jgi:DNA-binding transcriptional regulator YdaS (Cro superfamily)
VNPTPKALRAAIAALVGSHYGSVSEAARRYGVRMTNLADMLAGRRPIPAGLWAEIERDWHAAEIAPPPATLRPDDDRDGPCGAALETHLHDLMARATAAGWLPAEIVTAVFGWAVQQAVAGGGPDVAKSLLDQAAEMIELDRRLSLG